MELKNQEGKPEAINTPLLVVGVFEGAGIPSYFTAADAQADKLFTQNLQDFKGEYKQARVVHTLGKLPAQKVLFFGLGKQEEFDIHALRKAAGVTARIARDNVQVKEYATLLCHVDVGNADERAQVVAEGTLLGLYQFDKYKTKDRDKIKTIDTVTLIGGNGAVEKGRILAHYQNLARDLVNEPANTLTPEELANRAMELGKLDNVTVTVLNKKQIQEKGFTALLAVNQGSVNEPRFIVIEYNGGGKKVALCGKGITFDSGGLGIKPADAMADMKCDMGGAATVIGAVGALAALKAPIHVFGIISSTENMTGGAAYRPGDVIPTYHGKTIEIGHTDAEGRVVLADALAYAERDVQPEAIIDLATLTGAAVVALGDVYAPVFGDERVVSQLKKASESTYERIWELPLTKEYREMVKGNLGDVLNIGKKKREAGAITAAAFLREFVDKTPWAHIDIAGPAFTSECSELSIKGGTGFGVRLLTEALTTWQ